MIGENRQIVTNEPVEFEKQPVEVQDCRKDTDHSKGIHSLYPKLMKENRRLSTCNQLDLQILGSQPVMPKNLPDHWTYPLNTKTFWKKKYWVDLRRIPLQKSVATLATMLFFHPCTKFSTKGAWPCVNHHQTRVSLSVNHISNFPYNSWQVDSLHRSVKRPLYSWERVHGCLEPQNPIWPSDNGTNYKLASTGVDLMTLVRFSAPSLVSSATCLK